MTNNRGEWIAADADPTILAATQEKILYGGGVRKYAYVAVELYATTLPPRTQEQKISTPSYNRHFVLSEKKLASASESSLQSHTRIYMVTAMQPTTSHHFLEAAKTAAKSSSPWSSRARLNCSFAAAATGSANPRQSPSAFGDRHSQERKRRFRRFSINNGRPRRTETAQSMPESTGLCFGLQK